MSIKEKNKYKKIVSSCIVLSMVITGFATMFIAGPVEIVVAEEFEQPELSGVATDVPSLRIYGEEDAVYPTHSYYGESNFIYPKEYDPFDPGIIEKDSITFNPAFISGDDYDIIASGGNAHEKVFYRVFYEPGYTHPPDELMSQASSAPLYDVEPFDAIVTETTYHLVTYIGRDPIAGVPGQTNIVLPCRSSVPSIPGMDEANLLKVVHADNRDTVQRTDGMIWVEQQFIFPNIDYSEENVISFMDHKVEIHDYKGDFGSERLEVEVSYIGNMNEAHAQSQHYSIYKFFWGDGCNNYFNRGNNKQTGLYDHPAYRWYLRVESASESYLRISLGRVLAAGETFYVNGVRYDMPAVYVDNLNRFKYITFQSPIPKGEIVWDTSTLNNNVNDWSHVSSQWLASLPKDQYMWMLPPFNAPYYMIDDIGIKKSGCGPDMVQVPLAGLLLQNIKAPVQYYYVDQTIEERFDTSLTQRLFTDKGLDRLGAIPEDDQYWQWYNVYTMPNQYTEFVLPNQEEKGEAYDSSEGVSYTADGNEYLITTSLIAPNSNVDTYRDNVCKVYDEHEIFDRVYTISLEGEREDYYQMPRFVFEFDAVDPTDLFINDHEGKPTVRIYGEEDAMYPTQSWTGASDFVYCEEYDPFDPGIISKDSITFNPAFISGDDYDIIASGGNAHEKVFYRVFYEPGYTHPPDALMEHWTDVPLYDVEPFDAIVTETTYHLVTYIGRDPIAGVPGQTNIVLPCRSSVPSIPGMDEANLLKVVHADNQNTVQRTDGMIWVEQQFIYPNIDYSEENVISFMDHKLEIHDYKGDFGSERLEVEVSYIGNMNEAHAQSQHYSIYKLFWGDGCNNYFNRGNNKIEHYGIYDHPAYRWYLRVESASESYLRISLGRVLAAGETFYVNGVRYDMPAVYVDNLNRFKYITFQSPIPKGEIVWQSPVGNNVYDWSHVSSQWLASLPMNEPMWMLPPFNAPYYMIDDIGIKKSGCGPDMVQVPLAGLLLQNIKAPVQYYYVDQTIEERFDTSLTQRLFTDKGGNEYWQWYNVYTMPNQYTEFFLPNQEEKGEAYDSSEGVSYAADGNEYLITTSLYAPNSNFVSANRDGDCKEYDRHEIFSVVKDVGCPPIEHYYPRFVFEFDAYDSTGLFINGETHVDKKPTAIIIGPDEGCKNTLIFFDGSESYSNNDGGYIVSYHWDFGDEHYSSGPETGHVYTSTGEFTVCLTVTDNFGYSATTCYKITISDCSSDLQAYHGGPYTGFVCTPVQFFGSASGGVPPYSFSWDFGDGNTGIGPNPTHSYEFPGLYPVTLTVTDALFDTSSVTTTAFIKQEGEFPIISMGDVHLKPDSTGVGILSATGFTEEQKLASGTIRISFDDTIVYIDPDNPHDYVTTGPGITLQGVFVEDGLLSIIVTSASGKYGDFMIAEIEFEAIGDTGDSCDLIFVESSLADEDDNEIDHITENGLLTIGNNNDPPYPYIGDMNGNGNVDHRDVRYLAMHILGHPDYAELHDCGDVNSDGSVNHQDVRRLAMHILNPSGYPLYPGR